MKLLVVVDMQNDFIDAALGTKEAVQIVPAVIEKIKNHDDHVIATMDTHSPDYMNTQEGKNLPVEHCIKDTAGWEIKPEILAAIEEKNSYEIIEKPSFGSIDLAMILDTLNEEESIEAIEFIGLCTDICVISNVMIAKAALPEVPITVDAACCAGVTPESHKNALEAMKMCQIKIINE